MSRDGIFVYAELDAASAAHLRGQVTDAPLDAVDKHALAPGDEASFQACRICFGNVPAAWLERHPGLDWLQLESVGFEYYRGVDWARRQPALQVSNLRGLFDEPAAETAIAGLLYFGRGLDHLTRLQPERSWRPMEVRARSRRLAGGQAVILGAGNIGGCVRRRLEAFGCHVRSFARTSPQAELRDRAQLDAALPTVDFLIGCLPNTAETAGLLSRERLALLPSHACVVNIGRGSLIDEAALAEQLAAGRLGSAVLDVTQEEPLPPGHPFWTCPRLLLTQHSGGGYAGELRSKVDFFLENYRRYRAGEPLLNPVDLGAGY